MLPASLRRQVDPARFDEDATLNATRFVGLQGNLANSYSNALVQVLLSTLSMKCTCAGAEALKMPK